MEHVAAEFAEECGLAFNDGASFGPGGEGFMRVNLACPRTNVEECLRSETARLMLANSEFLLLFNQAATDRAELAKLLHISDTQLGYITNAEPGHGLLRIGGSLVPFSNTIPRDTELYRLLSTTPGEK